MNNETQKTLVFVGVAAVLTLLAIFWSPGSQVRTPDYAANIGEPFYPDFDNPNDATSMRVAVFESESAEVKDFAVELKDGQWSIPSHHNYPAEGKDRLSHTAASVIGIKRKALAGRRESDFKRLGVIDPLNKKETEIEGVGRRITLLDEANNPLCDYIIGDSIEGKSNSFYVRRPDKKQTYVAELEIDISTNFTDWIEPDLLKVESDDIAKVYLNKYSFDERSGRRVDESLLQLKKETTDEGKTSWKLDGLKEETEELQETEITDLVNELNNLKIVGVRPKPPGLSADLKLNQGIQLDLMTQVDLQTKGFFFQRFSDGSQGLSSNEGELIAVTKDGITYVLYFGEVFTGSEFDIEVGLDKPKKEEGEDEEKSEEEDKSADEGLKKSRYVFVTVSFNSDELGKKPVEPKKPEELEEKPSKKKEETQDKKEDKKDEEESEKKADEKAAKDDASSDDKNDKKSDDGEKESEKKEDDPKFEYEKALAKYKEDLQNYQTRMDTARKTVQELNERFADWYYVISADSFDKLNISREKLVKEKEKPKKEEKSKTDKESKKEETKASEKMKTDGKNDSEKKDEKKSESKSKDLPKIEPGKPGSSATKKDAESKKKSAKPAGKKEKKPEKSDDKPKVSKDKKETPKPAPKKEKASEKSEDSNKVQKKSDSKDSSKEKAEKKKADSN